MTDVGKCSESISNSVGCMRDSQYDKHSRPVVGINPPENARIIFSEGFLLELM